MKKKVSLTKKISLNKKQLNALNEGDLGHFLGGRMAAATGYTAGPGDCSLSTSSCCSHGNSSCCG